MSQSPEQHPTAHGTPRVPKSLFYDRVVPALIGGLVVVLLIVLVLTIGALVGAIPTQ